MLTKILQFSTNRVIYSSFHGTFIIHRFAFPAFTHPLELVQVLVEVIYAGYFYELLLQRVETT